ncbi:4'-phosphopantetheinyl transferase superfamily protein [Flavobacterium sp.]|uniref:4'-phosphopantetheinyl transferase family protein n=1 Tax=Flavobacterium sp. TaxID=239 RepID=UPI00286B18E6|nr:4'-phosphopantetheinyl transferase superfamily protein [Flavobacterium sp.]
MIGNDIVDLDLAQKESNWKRKGFLDKIFTKREQILINTAINSEIMVWNLWSRKEAAYKIYNRQTGTRAFISLQLECYDLEILDGIIFGKVLCNKNIYYTKTIFSSEFIYSVAAVNREDFEAIQSIKNTNEFIKIDGIPNRFNSQKSILRPVSISHHGRFSEIITI